jgi:MoaA/NifB/PqqE/SkfB family radical SAM enzyme
LFIPEDDNDHFDPTRSNSDEKPQSMSDDPLETPPNVAKIEFTDVDGVLAAEFGPRAVAYRRLYRESLNYHLGSETPEFPITLSLELVNRCNLSCVMCYTVEHTRPKKTLTLEAVERIFAECGRFGLPALQIAGGGEPLVYKQADKVMSLARSADVMDIFLCTNGVLLTEQLCEFVIRERIARVVVSLDAATPETYRKIRGKDELAGIEANVRRLVALRNEKGARLPLVRVSFCIQPENRHERAAFLEKWKDIVDYVDFQELQDAAHVDEVKEQGFDAPVMERLQPLEKPYCYYPFSMMSIWAGGEVSPCCSWYAKNLIIGNVHETSLKEIWDGPAIAEIRRQLLCGDLNPSCFACLAQRDAESFSTAKEAVGELAAREQEP